jgi:hypothetical protein
VVFVLLRCAATLSAPFAARLLSFFASILGPRAPRSAWIFCGAPPLPPARSRRAGPWQVSARNELFFAHFLAPNKTHFHFARFLTHQALSSPAIPFCSIICHRGVAPLAVAARRSAVRVM